MWNEILDFLNANYEKIAAIMGAGFLICAVLQKPLTWVFGGTHSFCMLIIYYQKGIIFNTLLMVYFIAVAIYGFLNWLKKNNKVQLPVTYLTNKSFIMHISISIIISAMFYLIIKNTSARFPILDSLTTAFSVMACYLQSRKKIQAWWFWLIADSFRIFLASYAGLYWILGLNIFSVFAVYCGYKMWSKKPNESL